MKHDEFAIGQEFYVQGNAWRCTDRGTRTISAIKLDNIETVVVTVTEDDRSLRQHRNLTREQAQAEGWFNGPPYALLETVFDEDDILACALERQSD